MIVDYASLKSAVSDWLLRDDLVSVIPSFIQLAEASFNRRLRFRAMLRQRVLLIEGEKGLLPDDCMELRKVQLDGVKGQANLPSPKILDYVSPYQIAALQTDPISFYSLVGNVLILDGDSFVEEVQADDLIIEKDEDFLIQDTPEGLIEPEDLAAYRIGVTYYGKIAALSDANPVNELLTLAPDLYLYSALQQAAPYLKEDARIALWKGLADQAIAEQQAADDRAEHGTSPLVMRPRHRRGY